jgi:hypothetical protein
MIVGLTVFSQSESFLDLNLSLPLHRQGFLMPIFV